MRVICAVRRSPAGCARARQLIIWTAQCGYDRPRVGWAIPADFVRPPMTPYRLHRLERVRVSKKLKIRCFLCIWRLATYVIILYKPYSLSGYCDNWISQSKNISENILRDYSDFDLFVIHNRFVSKKIHSFESLRSVSPAQAYAAFCRF